MIETNWGHPVMLTHIGEGTSKRITTIEQAKHWLLNKWPVADAARERALESIDSAMFCMIPAQAARNAFVNAANCAGFEARCAD